jgi:hypothetical protein
MIYYSHLTATGAAAAAPTAHTTAVQQRCHDTAISIAQLSSNTAKTVRRCLLKRRCLPDAACTVTTAIIQDTASFVLSAAKLYR